MQRWRLSFDFDHLRALLTVNIVFWLLSILIGVLAGVSMTQLLFGANQTYNAILFELGALWPAAVAAGEFWRIISSAFLHLGIIHLGLNMFALWQFGGVVYEYYGGKLLFVFYVFSAIGASLASYVFDIAGVGASGAVFGILGVLLANTIKRNPYTPSFPIDREYLFQILIYSFIIGLYPGLSINLVAHVGGLITGFGLGYLLDHKMSAHRSKLSKSVEGPLYWSSLIFVLLSFFLLSANFIYGFLLTGSTG